VSKDDCYKATKDGQQPAKANNKRMLEASCILEEWIIVLNSFQEHEGILFNKDSTVFPFELDLGGTHLCLVGHYDDLIYKHIHIIIKVEFR
jgi:hypothetical protein